MLVRLAPAATLAPLCAFTRWMVIGAAAPPRAPPLLLGPQTPSSNDARPSDQGTTLLSHLHYTTLLSPPLHHATLISTTPHHTTPHHTILHYNTIHYTTLHYSRSVNITTVTLHYYSVANPHSVLLPDTPCPWPSRGRSLLSRLPSLQFPPCDASLLPHPLAPPLPAHSPPSCMVACCCQPHCSLHPPPRLLVHHNREPSRGIPTWSCRPALETMSERAVHPRRWARRSL